MIREDRFVQSHAPYAVDLSSLKAERRVIRWPGNPADGAVYYDCSVQAVWFRRRKGVTVACIGVLSDFCDTVPDGAEAFLGGYTDGRYGGDTWARWDGETLWMSNAAEAPPADIQAHDRYLNILQPMLDNYPAVPEGYDGWWTFKGAK